MGGFIHLSGEHRRVIEHELLGKLYPSLRGDCLALLLSSITECEYAEHPFRQVLGVDILDPSVYELTTRLHSVIGRLHNHEHVIDRLHGGEQRRDHVADLPIPLWSFAASKARRVD